MTDQEREQVLKMIQDGKISAEEGLKLMQTLDQTPLDDERAAEAEPGSAPAGAAADKAGQDHERSNFDTDPRILRVKNAVRRFWQIPLWIGVAVTIFGAWAMYSQVMAGKINFWFYCLTTPLLFLGVLIIVAAIGSRQARWLFVDVRQKPGDKPERIFLGFPLPLKFIGWLMRIIATFAPGLRKEMDEDKDGPGFDGAMKIMDVLDQSFTSNEPFVVDVDEDKDGERVRVYIG